MKLISVTTALQPFFDASKINLSVLDAAKSRGTAVHRGCAAIAKGLPAFASNGSENYLISFTDWFTRYVRRVLFVESEFSDPHTYGIVGHPDLVAELTDGRVMVVDYKTPVTESRTWRSQLATYCYLVKTVVGEVGGMALMLSPHGAAARAIYYQYQAEDFAAFVAALTAYRYFKEA